MLQFLAKLDTEAGKMYFDASRINARISKHADILDYDGNVKLPEKEGK